MLRQLRWVFLRIIGSTQPSYHDAHQLDMFPPGSWTQIWHSQWTTRCLFFRMQPVGGENPPVKTINGDIYHFNCTKVEAIQEYVNFHGLQEVWRQFVEMSEMRFVVCIVYEMVEWIFVKVYMLFWDLVNIFLISGEKYYTSWLFSIYSPVVTTNDLLSVLGDSYCRMNHQPAASELKIINNQLITILSLKLAFAPDVDPFLLGFGLVSGVNSLLVSGREIEKRIDTA